MFLWGRFRAGWRKRASGRGGSSRLADPALPSASTALLVGRDPSCDVRLVDERVSWRHLSIELHDGLPLVTDLGSSNGTSVDGSELKGLRSA